MDTLSPAVWQQLIEHAAEPCVSLYLPTYSTWPLSKENPIRLMDLVRRAEAQLAARGMECRRVAELLRPVRTWAETVNSWKTASDGLAIFRSPAMLHVLRLPRSFSEDSHVAGRFHLLPLAPLLCGDGTFYVLAVCANHVGLYEGRRDGMTPLALRGLPENLRQALNYDSPQAMRQAHGGLAQGKTGQQTVYHGQGGKSDFRKDELESYFRLIDRTLHRHLADSHAPLIFAGVDSLFPIFREVNSYPHLLDHPVAGNPELFNERELHARTWAIAGPHFAADAERAIERACDMIGTDRFSTDVEEVITAAREGQVDTLLVAEGAVCWGIFDPVAERAKVFDEVTADGEDLLNLAAVETLARGGRVFMFPAARMPGGRWLAATFRFAPVDIDRVARLDMQGAKEQHPLQGKLP